MLQIPVQLAAQQGQVAQVERGEAGGRDPVRVRGACGQPRGLPHRGEGVQQGRDEAVDRVRQDRGPGQRDRPHPPLLRPRAARHPAQRPQVRADLKVRQTGAEMQILEWVVQSTFENERFGL